MPVYKVRSICKKNSQLYLCSISNRNSAWARKGQSFMLDELPLLLWRERKNSGDRLSVERYKEIIEGCIWTKWENRKVDPCWLCDRSLNYEHFDQLFETSVKHNFITGMHTKLLKISNKFLEIVSDKNIRDKSYVSISVDAGAKESYNLTHGITTKVDVLMQYIEY